MSSENWQKMSPEERFLAANEMAEALLDKHGTLYISDLAAGWELPTLKPARKPTSTRMDLWKIGGESGRFF